MARSTKKRTLGNLLQRMGGELSGGSGHRGRARPRRGPTTTTRRSRPARRGTPTSAKGLLRRLLG